MVFPGMYKVEMRGFLDIDAWVEWIRSQDTAWLFLLILALVVAVVTVWSSTLRADHTGKRADDDTGT